MVFERRDSLGEEECYGYAVATIGVLEDGYEVEFINNAYGI